jgi:probable HAF family extracellular repeat protein
MLSKLTAALILCLAAAALAGQASPIPQANLRFSNLGSSVGLFPLATNNDSTVGELCCQSAADPNALKTVGFLLNPQGWFPQFLTTLPSGGSSSFTSGINASGSAAVGGYCVIDCASFVSQHGFILTLDYGDEYFGFSQIDFPGAYATMAGGVNSSSSVVGTFCLNSTCYFQAPDHGFAYVKGVFTEIKFPGAAATGVFGVNDAGDMVGGYGLSTPAARLPGDSTSNPASRAPSRAASPTPINPNGVPVYGFLLSGGIFTSFNPPGSIATYPAAINNSGMIVGTFIDAANHQHGFLYKGGKFQEIDHPNAILTTADGINDKNQVVGTYETSDGFVSGYIAQ